MKKIIFTLIFLSFLGFTGFVNAQERNTRLIATNSALKNQVLSDRSASKAAKLDVRVTKTAENQQSKIENLKGRASNEIDRRIQSLNKLITRIQTIKKLSTVQKSSITAQIQTQIDALNVLKTKINADTDLVTLQADVKSIITDYRIYAFFIQDINLLVASERMGNTAEKIGTVSAKLQVRINEAKTAGKDIASLTTLMTDLKNKQSQAQAIIAAARTELLSLNAQGYPANKTNLMSIKTKLQTAAANLRAASQDVRQIIKGLREVGLKVRAKEAPKANPTEIPVSSSSAVTE